MRPFSMIFGLLIFTAGFFYAFVLWGFSVGMAQSTPEAESAAWSELTALPLFYFALGLAAAGAYLFTTATWQTANESLRRRGLRPPLKAETDRLEGSDSLASDPIPADWRPEGDSGA